MCAEIDCLEHFVEAATHTTVGTTEILNNKQHSLMFALLAPNWFKTHEMSVQKKPYICLVTSVQ